MLDSLRYLGIKPDVKAPLTPGKPMPGLEFPPIRKAATVPSVLGLPIAEAQKVLTQAGFMGITEGQGEWYLTKFPMEIPKWKKDQMFSCI
jgi:stage V sporulation protein D (sporulation-specific penicillin-binding protein)